MEGNSDKGDLGRRYKDAVKQLIENATGRSDVDVLLAGGRSQAAKDFAIRRARGEDVVLLVDAEEVVDGSRAAWEHLGALTGGAQIARPATAGDLDAHLMAVTTETWVLSGTHLPSGIRVNPLFLDDHATTETIPKALVLSDAQLVFPGMKMKRKVLLGLGKVDHRRLRRKCPHARRFLEHIG